MQHAPERFPRLVPSSRRRRTNWLTLAAVGAAALTCAPAFGQTPSGAGEPTARPARLLGDIKAFVTAPLHAQRPQWVRFGAVLGAVVAARQYDEKMRRQFGSTALYSVGSPDTRDSHDASLAAAAIGGTWLAAVLFDDDDGRREAGSMLEAAALSSAAAYVLKQAAGRERPYVAADPDRWRRGGDAFPSLHVTAAFAIGTVLAESGNERHRWIRRVLGYGIAAGTAYQRMDHDAHWFSDTVAGAGLGLATARFVMQRRESSSARTQVRLVPSERGLALTYAVALRQ